MSEQKLPTKREVASNIEAFIAAPWGEVLDAESTYEFLSSFYNDKDGDVIKERANETAQPYLYVHTFNYHKDFPALVEEEFAGEGAYYRAVNPGPIHELLSNCGSITYLANAHADKKVQIPDELKPRLKVFPDIISSLFAQNKSDSIVGYTHRSTPVFRAVIDLVQGQIGIRAIPYEIFPRTEGINENHKIDRLELFVIEQV